MSNLSKSKTSLFVNIRVLCTVALLTACATAIAYICKSFTITPYLRVTFENLPLILAGYLFGPWAGLVAGLASDFLNTLVTYGLGQLNPIITLGAGVVGFTAGAVSRWILPKKGTVQLAVSVAAAHVMGNMIVKSIGLMIYFSYSFLLVLPRIPLYICIGIIEFFFLYVLLRNKGVNKMLGAICRS